MDSLKRFFKKKSPSPGSQTTGQNTAQHNGGLNPPDLTDDEAVEQAIQQSLAATPAQDAQSINPAVPHILERAATPSTPSIPTSSTIPPQTTTTTSSTSPTPQKSPSPRSSASIFAPKSDSDEETESDDDNKGDSDSTDDESEHESDTNNNEDDLSLYFSTNPEMSKQSLSIEDVLNQQQRIISSVADVLSVPPASAAVLLRISKWNREKLMSDFNTSAAEFCKKHGVSMVSASSTGTPGTTVTCAICFDELDGSLMSGLACEHRFCPECWTGYLNSEINSGTRCLLSTCPYPKCTFKVDSALFERFTKPPQIDKYKRFVVESFVDDNSLYEWCSNPKCDRILFSAGNINFVNCTCGESKCFSCGNKDHRPASCLQLKQWVSKDNDETQTEKWIEANTKKCPKCVRGIEKNGGCNHMTCNQCKHEFCWVCMADWSTHGVNTGGFFSCNVYEPGKDTSSAARAKAKQDLQRYLHFYQRWQIHSSNEAFISKIHLQIAQRIEEIEETSTEYVQTEYILRAASTIKVCRQILQNSYILAYFIPSGMPSLTLFQDAQARLEYSVEELSKCLDGEGKATNKPKVLELVSQCKLHQSTVSKFYELALSLESSPLASSSKNLSSSKTPKKKKYELKRRYIS